MRYLFPLSALLLLTSCMPVSQYQRATSGSIGCPMDELVVSDVDSLGSEAAWTASCRGKKFHCSTGRLAGNTLCTPELPKGN